MARIFIGTVPIIMKHILKLRAALLLVLATLGITLSGVYAQPRAQEQHAVYLPLIRGGSSSQSPSPTPSPSSSS